MSAARLELAEAFLREAVFRSRERQAASVALASAKSKGGNCGLGEKPALDLDLSRRAKEIVLRLWPDGLEGTALEKTRKLLEDWVVEQDAIDRKRNHHMKTMRMKHGFERDAYPPGVAREFDAGLERVNSEETARRRAVAQELLSM
jgi:hypothetical protein